MFAPPVVKIYYTLCWLLYYTHLSKFYNYYIIKT